MGACMKDSVQRREAYTHNSCSEQKNEPVGFVRLTWWWVKAHLAQLAAGAAIGLLIWKGLD